MSGYLSILCFCVKLDRMRFKKSLSGEEAWEGVGKTDLMELQC